MLKKPGFKFILVLIISFVFLYFFFRSVDWKEVFRHLVGVDLKFFALMILLVPLHFLTRAIRWEVLLKHEKSSTSLYNRFAANAVGFTVTLIFPGRLGELIKPLYLAQKEDIRKGFTVGTVVIERIFDIFTMCFLIGLFLVAKPLYAPFFQVDDTAFQRLYFWGLAGFGIAFGLLIISLGLYFFRDKALKLVSFLARIFPQKIRKSVLSLVDEFIEGLKFFHSVGDLLKYLLLSFVVWMGIIFYYWICFFAYNLKLSYFLICPYVFLILVGASIPTPGMVGGFDYFSKLGFTSLYHLDPSRAVGMTIVIHAVQVGVTCLIGYVILWKEGLSLFQLKKLGENTEK
ncbi:MAG TPA: flippase-like domain-containing protein [Candidatus Aminicenantes bacterium]|nr:flippase-like domain-containing protein [Candidatus Aminicenantes bacterium]